MDGFRISRINDLGCGHEDASMLFRESDHLVKHRVASIAETHIVFTLLAPGTFRNGDGHEDVTIQYFFRYFQKVSSILLIIG